MKLDGYSLALRAIANTQKNSRDLSKSLEQLSSGLRINQASDDPSGMFIADSLRSDYSALSAAARNANEIAGIINIADKAVDEQIKIADKIRSKALQAASDSNSSESKRALQNEISRLIRSFDFISQNTEYNGKNLLLGGFANQKFQVGISSNQTVSVSFGSIISSTVGHARFATSGAIINNAQDVDFTMNDKDGKAIRISGVRVDNKAGTGLGAVANRINSWSHVTGAKATWHVEYIGSAPSGDVASNFTINGETIGAVSGVKQGDSDGRLTAAINAKSSATGVTAFTDESGNIHLKSLDGRGITVANAANTGISGDIATAGRGFYGYITLSRTSGEAFNFQNADELNLTGTSTAKETSVSLATVLNKWDTNTQQALGVIAPGATAVESGILTIEGANVIATVAQATSEQVSVKRANIGASSAQLQGIADSLKNQQVSIKSAENEIRSVDFASVSAKYSKQNILSQAGSFAVAQANKLNDRIIKFLEYN